MPTQQKIITLCIALSIFLTILELVRRRRLREEYSVLWLATGIILVFLILRYDFLVKLTSLIGAGLPTSTLFFFAIIFLILVCLQFSVEISKLTNQVKNLTQQMAILEVELKKK